MLNWFRSLAPWAQPINDDLDDLEESVKRPNPTPHGPQKPRYYTEGQIRRRAARLAASQRRKATKRHRRDVLLADWHLRVLESQLAAYDRGGPEQRAVFEKIFTDNFGSLDEARKYHLAAVATKEYGRQQRARRAGVA